MATKSWIGGTGAQSWSLGSNWSDGSAPVSGDTVYFTSGTSVLTTNLNQSAVTLAALIVTSGFTGGTPADGTPLQIGAPIFRMSRQFNSGSYADGGTTRFVWDAGSVAFDAVVDATGTPADAGLGALQIKGGTNASTLNVNGGYVSAGARPGVTATLNKVRANGGVTILGDGLTLSGTAPSVTQEDGTLLVGGAVATLVQRAGVLYAAGVGKITTATINGEARLNHRPTSGTVLDTLTIEGGGEVFFDGDPRTANILNAIAMYAGAKLHAFGKTQLQTNGASLQTQFVGCAPGDCEVDIGPDATATWS